MGVSPGGAQFPLRIASDGVSGCQADPPFFSDA